MLKKLVLATAAALGLSAGAALAAGAEAHVEDFAFPHEGPFGAYDQMQLQRGLQVYTEICSSCHGLQYVPIRTLGDEGGPALPEDQVRAYAATLLPVLDPETGEERPRVLTDPFPEHQLPEAPDLSLMAKARAGFHGPYGLGLNQLLRGTGGPEYIATLLTAYEDPPACAPDDMEGYYNTAFTSGGFPPECLDEHGKHTVPGSWIAMAPPLYGDDVVYADGAPTDIESVSQDVAAFLMWAAEPKLAARKEAGFQAVLFLTILSVLLYLTNKRLWAPVKRRAKGQPAE
jgi:ubiquinol-cytochrome c reductase cytochrome c1 subunit